MSALADRLMASGLPTETSNLVADAIGAAGGIIYAAQYPTLTAAFSALSAGDMLVLASDTTYTVTAAISSSLANLHIWAPSWNTVIKRGSALTSTMLQLTGAGCLIEGMTFDGNSVAAIGAAEVQLSGVDSRITNTQVINSSATINIALSGARCRADHNKVAGLGVALSTQRGYGIWAINHVPTTIDHNTITGTGIDAIGADGPGTIVSDNYINACHCWASSGGSQLAMYAYASADAASVCANNFVGQGGGVLTGGVDIAGNNLSFTGNTIVNQYGGGISVSAGKGITITGNTVLNVGLDESGVQDGIVVHAGVTDFSIVGNRIADDNGTPKMRFSIVVIAGASDRYTIVGNLLWPNNRPNSGIQDNGTGVIKHISENTGVDTILPAVASAGTITLPANPNFRLTGSVGVTQITASGLPIGNSWTAFPDGAVVFTAGNNIKNTVTTVANTPLFITSDASGNLWLAR